MEKSLVTASNWLYDILEVVLQILQNLGIRIQSVFRLLPVFTQTQQLSTVPEILEGSVTQRALQGERFRVHANALNIDCEDFKERYHHVLYNKCYPDRLRLYGRVVSKRASGQQLKFVDITQNGTKVQLVFNAQNFINPEVSDKAFAKIGKLKRGYHIQIVGRPGRTKKGELSIMATEIPLVISTSQDNLPERVTDAETIARNPHLNMVIGNKPMRMLKLRSHILNFLQSYLFEKKYHQVHTPIIGPTAGGAVARPFLTNATEFSGRRLALRISPEISLKRLMLGDAGRIFEIGPCFRNEGIDSNHNPEFWMIESYTAWKDIDWLLQHIEDLLRGLSEKLEEEFELDFTIKGKSPWRTIDFITTIQESMDFKLPYLARPDAASIILQAMVDRDLPIPANPNLPRLLDKLCAIYIEPKCVEPTWIINQPECLSPLAKSMPHPSLQQAVAIRGELFIKGQEIINAYEEENSPIHQRRKFIAQQEYNKAENIDEQIDESYLEALEWALAPCVGWGCGIERLCMLFGGTDRIADVMPFGNLRNVLSLPDAKKDVSKVVKKPKGNVGKENELAEGRMSGCVVS